MQSRATMSLASTTGSTSSTADIPTHRPSGEPIPISEQLMQVDQAITLTLQEIDANFARCHQTITGKILPSIRRYGVASHNTWQGARFWHRFFETASDINLVPTYEGEGEAETSQEPSSNSYTSQDQEASTSYSEPLRRAEGEEDDAIRIDDSGELGEGDFEPPKLSEASRAATERLRPSEEEGSGRKAWENVESPFEKLKREVDRGAATPRKAGGSKLATQVLRNQHEQSRSARKVQATPRRGGTATANPFALNGMDIQSAKQVDRWNGIADLRKTPLAKVKGGILKGKQTAMQNTVDDSIGSLDWPPGMSPPVTMQFSVPQKKYMKTPAKAAAQLAVDDLLRTIEGASPATRRNLIQRIGADSHSLRGTGSPVNLTSTPLKRGPLKGRKSLPTPPTVTKRIGGTAKLTRGVQDTQSPATSSSARLLDEDEDGIDPDEDDDLGTGLSKLGLTQTSAGIDKLLQGGTEDDEDSEEEDESDSDDEEAMPASSQIPTVRANKNGSDYPTGSSLASNSRSIDQDTLFGIRDPNKVSAPSSSALKHSAKFSSSSDAPTQSSSSVNNGSSSGQYQPINHKLYEQGTVYGGRPLLNDDREDTYSAPSPTPATTSMGRRSK